MGEEEKKAQLERNPIMPQHFSDENDENRNIQSIKINKPDFDTKAFQPEVFSSKSHVTTAKTLTTMNDI